MSHNNTSSIPGTIGDDPRDIPRTRRIDPNGTLEARADETHDGLSRIQPAGDVGTRRGVADVMREENRLAGCIAQIRRELPGRLPTDRARITFKGEGTVDPDILTQLDTLLTDFPGRVRIEGIVPANVQALLVRRAAEEEARRAQEREADNTDEADGETDDDADGEAERAEAETEDAEEVAEEAPAPRRGFFSRIGNALANTRLGRLVTGRNRMDPLPERLRRRRMPMNAALDEIEQQLPIRTERARITVHRPGPIDAPMRERIVNLHRTHPNRVFFAGDLTGLDDEILTGRRVAPANETIVSSTDTPANDIPMAEVAEGDGGEGEVPEELRVVTPTNAWLEGTDEPDAVRPDPDAIPMAEAVNPPDLTATTTQVEQAPAPVSLEPTAQVAEPTPEPVLPVDPAVASTVVAPEPTTPVIAASPNVAQKPKVTSRQRQRAVVEWIAGRLHNATDLAKPELTIRGMQEEDFTQPVLDALVKLLQAAKGQVLLINCVVPPSVQAYVDGVNRGKAGRRLSMLVPSSPAILNYGSLSDMALTPVTPAPTTEPDGDPLQGQKPLPEGPK